MNRWGGGGLCGSRQCFPGCECGLSLLVIIVGQPLETRSRGDPRLGGQALPVLGNWNIILNL